MRCPGPWLARLVQRNVGKQAGKADSANQSKKYLPPCALVDELPLHDTAIREKIPKPVLVNTVKRARVYQPVAQHELTVLEQAHIGLDGHPLFIRLPAPATRPRSALPELSMNVIEAVKPVPQLKPEPRPIGFERESGVVGGIHERGGGDSDADDRCPGLDRVHHNAGSSVRR